jgi:hypothetical protein
MSQTVDKSAVKGVSVAEATANAATHGPHDRSTVHGVTSTEATSNAVLNTQSAAE